MDVTLYVRIPTALAERLDRFRLFPDMPDGSTAIGASRSSLVRHLIRIGLDVLERPAPKRAKPKPRRRVNPSRGRA